MSSVRERLVQDFARWVATCAVRSNSPVRARAALYAAIDAVDFAPLFDRERGPIGESEFGVWHSSSVAAMLETEPRLNVGWAAKLVNEYLKTACYVGGYGRAGLSQAIHPPIDNGLVNGLKCEFTGDTDLREALASLSPMSRMDTYDKYECLIEVCRRVARKTGCSLMESEIFWE